MDGLNREIEVRFGTPNPVPFKDARTKEEVQLRAFGDAMVVVKDTTKFQSVDDVPEILSQLRSQSRQPLLPAVRFKAWLTGHVDKP